MKIRLLNFKKILCITIMFPFVMLPFTVFSQGAAINISGAGANPSAMLDVSSTNSGLLIPRMTEFQRMSISNPAIGLMIFQTDGIVGFWYFDGSAWVQSVGAQGATGATGPQGISGSAGPSGNAIGDLQYWNGSAWVILPAGNSGQVLSTNGSIPSWVYQYATAETVPPSVITLTGATLSGVVNPMGLATTVTFEYGLNTSYGNTVSAVQNPLSGTTNSVVSASISGLKSGITYYYRVVATNSLGTTYGSNMEFKVPKVGDYFAGGIVFYIDASLTYGLVCATSDQSAGANWGCQGTELSGADGTALGTGNQNTIDILAGCSTSGIAARLCNGININGYSDWYLPSKDELSLMYTNLLVVNPTLDGFTKSRYWSSTETYYFGPGGGAWFTDFANGGTSSTYKSESYRVRAIRRF